MAATQGELDKLRVSHLPDSQRKKLHDVLVRISVLDVILICRSDYPAMTIAHSLHLARLCSRLPFLARGLLSLQSASGDSFSEAIGIYFRSNTMFNNNLQGGLKKIAMLLALSLFTTTVSMSASADLVSTEQLSAQQEVEKVRNEVKNYIARDEVREKMLELGVSHADVDQRIDNLTDQEVMELYEGMDSMPAGEGVLGVVISLLVIFILLDVAGVTDIFPAV
jgi:hypothetical protein